MGAGRKRGGGQRGKRFAITYQDGRPRCAKTLSLDRLLGQGRRKVSLLAHCGRTLLRFISLFASKPIGECEMERTSWVNRLVLLI